VNRYVLGVGARDDLLAIWEYIARDSLDAADSLIASLFDAFALIAQNPGIGHSRRDLTDLPILFWPVGAYLVLYRKPKACVEVIAVVHGMRDIPVFLRQRA
jgi:plasmid stabilization system protein ParE